MISYLSSTCCEIIKASVPFHLCLSVSPMAEIINSKVGSKCCEIIQANVRWFLSARLKSALSGIGAARTATCVRKETASRRGRINIWRALSGLPEGGVG